MQLTVTDWVVFLYNLGVLVSGGYVVMVYDINGAFFFGVMFAFAIFWTIYFRFYMQFRLTELSEREETTSTEN
ncbi:hypothetical protein ACNS7O_16255 (plasmid) [Haloferacaceae archaeon DSL9]